MIFDYFGLDRSGSATENVRNWQINLTVGFGGGLLSYWASKVWICTKEIQILAIDLQIDHMDSKIEQQDQKLSNKFKNKAINSIFNNNLKNWPWWHDDTLTIDSTKSKKHLTFVFCHVLLC